MHDRTRNTTQLAKAGEQLNRLAWMLDDMFRIPGLNWRFGLDALIGLIPGVGDVVSALLSLLILFRAFQFKLPRIVMARMMLNSLIDVGVGSIPFVGDLFDFVWKSNDMNMKLFRQYAEQPERSTKHHWIFIGLLIFLFVGALAAILVGMYLILRLMITRPESVHTATAFL